MFEILSIDTDHRLQAHCALVKTDYRWFMQASSGAEENLKIQRKIISGTKPYATLRADLKRGCLLPPLVLAVKGVQAPHDNVERQALSNHLAIVAPADVYIIDGLQRTNAIRQSASELVGDELEEFLDRTMRVEIWLDISFGALAYRMLLLNAGQRPMSIKHQVEILSMKLQEDLSTVPDIDIFTSISGRRRTQSGQFQLAKLSQAFQAWLQGQPNVDLKNTVMEQLLAENAIDVLGADAGRADGAALGSGGFKGLVEWIVAMDHRMSDENRDFLSNDTVLLGLAAAVGAAERNESIRPRMERCLSALKEVAMREGSDLALAVNDYDSLRSGIDSSKRNVGEATRDLVFYAFQEHFLSDGLKQMSECWRFAAGRG
ncbi:hypothetical protein [Thermomonas sp.]|uniref:hypothetical protein n=1 Tax=Thermomonas sp. TaxID=1971895 RepID=UPI0035B29905